MSGTRDFNLINGPETSTLPTASSPSANDDFMTLGYADTNYARRSSWFESKNTVALLKAVTSSATVRVRGQAVFVTALAKFFFFDETSTAVNDDTTVIIPNDITHPAPGRWLQTAAAAVAGQYQAVVAATPIAGFSTHTSLTSAQTAVSSDQQVLVMPGDYSAETLTLSKRLKWVLGGYGVVLGNLVWATAGDDSHFSGGFRVTGTVTIDANTNGALLDVIVPTAEAILQDSTSEVFVQGFRENG